ncbi:hypothetical protein EOD41_09005 [Mucilaginibacter limnophilus]|uniref:Lipoprotein n=1 Tax=Mucilaginibacter limnophilus TaxID=1932778 RepID=A0A437MWU4_9SPHI|nr:DUF6252 family protein [Mucilaginibacter limnophilus]RVU02076.1 hypothetical protein EOD41_09005 [Mucilaginibacter limnophilus]
MKKILIMLLVATASLTACKKDDDKKKEEATGGNATVTAGNYGFDGGNAGKFSSTKAGMVQVTAAGQTTFTVTAIRDGGNESITIILLQKAAVGKYRIGPQDDNGGIMISKDYAKAGDAALNYSTDLSGTNMAGGGEINITKVEGNTVEGTFYAVAYNGNQKEAFAEQGSFKGILK